MTPRDIAILEADIESALQRASLMKLELVVYLLSMARLELVSEVDDQTLQSLAEPKVAVLLQ